MNPVFVYGTLRKGGSNHFRMAGADFVGGGKVSGKMFRIDWYPALLLGGDTSVKGELYLVSDKTLAELDDFEGITPDCEESREYHRVKTPVRLDSGETEEGWVWEWIGDTETVELLDTEDWLTYEPNPS
ncbi:gamma-glutamylcyclotransferase [Luteolibacter sp. AS25]|uniref:gamma-glutamylcyclotransferase family protein n=1 Tax=Luteolibacter sp. AS25 TaxID=3135776 RepID=UPI00398B7CF9